MDREPSAVGTVGAEAARAASHDATDRGRGATGTLPSAHSSSSPMTCLQGSLRLGHEHLHAGPACSTTTSYGSAEVPR